MPRRYIKKIDYSHHNKMDIIRRPKPPKDPARLSVWRTWLRFWHGIDGGRQTAKFYGLYDTVSSQWFEFETFYEDVGPRPPGMRLARKDKSKPFGPKNFEWRHPRESSISRDDRARALRICLALVRGKKPADIARDVHMTVQAICHIRNGRSYRAEMEQAREMLESL